MKDNQELVADGEAFISKYIFNKFEKECAPEIVDTVHRYLTSESVLAHVGKHLGLTDLILSEVRAF